MIFTSVFKTSAKSVFVVMVIVSYKKRSNGDHWA